MNSLWAHFGVIWARFGHMRATLGYFEVTLGSLWSHFEYMRARFQKTIIFPTCFNDSIKLSSQCLVTLKSFLIELDRGLIKIPFIFDLSSF